MLESTAEVVGGEAKLPPKVDHPVEALHLVIAQVSKELEEHLTARGEPTQRFMQLQIDFERKLVSSVPEFIPVLEDDYTDEVEKTDVPNLPKHDEDGNQVFLNTVHEHFSKYRNARSSVILHAARSAMIRDLVQCWEELCHTYNKVYWSALQELVHERVSAACADKPDVTEIAM